MLPGMIMLWSGAVVDIPWGWHLCDGTFGTPDLRDNFVIGAGNTYNPDDTGGAATHNHTFTTDGHFHGLPAGFNIPGGANFQSWTDTVQDTGTTDNSSSLPPYYALCYIMKI